MNTRKFFDGCVLFTLAVLVSLLSFGGCGDTEDDPINPTAPVVSEFKWPPGATGESWEVTDTEVAELLALNPPSDWHKTTEDPELYNKYYLAELLKQFGDIPEVRYTIAFHLKPKDNITIAQAIALSEATYRLNPNTENLKALRFISSLPLDGYLPPQDEPKNEIEAWVKKDPEGLIETQRLLYVEKYGDIPEVHTYLNLLRKQFLGERLTEAERQEMNAALLHLQQLRAEDENKQDDDNDN